MTNDELYDRIQALERFAIDYLQNRRDRTFGQFWADFDAFDPALHSALKEAGSDVDESVLSALNALADTTDVLSEGSHTLTDASQTESLRAQPSPAGSGGETHTSTGRMATLIAAKFADESAKFTLPAAVDPAVALPPEAAPIPPPGATPVPSSALSVKEESAAFVQAL